MRTPRSRRLAGTGCTNCGGSDAIEIRLQLNDGMELDFHCCHRCEHRWWDADGEVIDLNTVLDLVRQR